MRKIFAAVLAVISLSCLGLAVACNNEPEYFTLTYVSEDGVEINCEIPSGYEVKEGYNVSFTLGIDGDIVGTPVVQVNSVELAADANGTYTFKMKENSVISVGGITKLNGYKVTFDRGDRNLVTYLSDDGDTETGIAVTAGDEIKFTLKTSVYCGDSDYTVLANTTILNADANGVYTVAVTGNTTVTVSGLEEDVSFIGRQNGGSGTAADPYRIEKPIDLYAMALLVGDSFYQNSTYAAYYRLENDIDMQGEQLYIIGDGITSFFAGNFNGNHHTISNYYMTDTEVDQTYFYEVFMPYIGLFGFVQSIGVDSGEIYDLNLENFTIDVNGAKAGDSFSVGAVVGCGMGARLTGCTANGVITADADTNYFGYMGGLIGFQQSYIDVYGTRYYSMIQSCASNVELRGDSGYIYCAGGISGFLYSIEEKTAALILNSYSTGNISGAMNAGGIAGRVSPFSSIQGCYATGIIEASSSVGDRDGYEEYAYANAGGIAGYLDYDCVISDSFFTGKTYAYSTAGSKYQQNGAIAGGRAESGKAYIEAEGALVINCYSAEDNTIDDAFIKGTLGWDAGDWVFNGDGRPVVNTQTASKAFTLTVQLGSQTYNGKSSYTLDVSDIYIPMSYWYVVTDGLPEFIASDSGLRTYGYYFDAALTQKVPYAYIPTNDITLYVGFADYTEVSGEYYLKTGDNGSKILVLGDDGTLTYRDGALSLVSYYTYNGEYVLLRDTYLAVLADASLYGYYSFKAEVGADGTMKIYDNTVYPSASPMLAVKKIAGFTYGEYYGANASYVFHKDGTGIYNGSAAFTYTVSGNSLTVLRDGITYNGTLENNEIKIGSDSFTACDEFVGVWEKSAGSHKQYTFDGKGGWSYEYFGYDSQGRKVSISSASGTYSRNADGTFTLNNGVRMGFDEVSGLLTVGGETYYKQNSYVGTWRFFNAQEPIEITLNGINNDGYGSASVNYGAYGNFDAYYEAVAGADGNVILVFYYSDVQLGYLVFDQSNKTLAGEFYSVLKGAVKSGVTFCLYDDFRGEWISDVLELVEFNGLGNYNLSGTDSYLAVKGSVKINGKTVGAYTLENGTLTGSFTYDGVEYSIAYDEEKGVIVVTGGNKTFNLEERDGWYGNDLVAEDGTVYSFDGRGNLASGGTLTVTTGGGASTEYTYKVTSTGVSIGTNGSLAADRTGGYTLTLNGKQSTLTVYNLFTGTWLIGGTNGEYLVIGKIGANFTATGSFRGDKVTFEYDPDGKYLSFEYEGGILYINSISAPGVALPELTIGTVNSVSSYLAVCINESIVDEFIGAYTSEDGTEIIFDGFSNSVFAGGMATKYDSNGLVYDYYTYSVNKFGMLLLKNAYEQYFFVSCDAGVEGAFAKDGSYYKLVEPNDLYNIKKTVDADNAEISYEFDGVDKVVASDGTVYTYEIISVDKFTLEYTLKLTDSDGKVYTAVLDYGENPYKLTIKAE